MKTLVSFYDLLGVERNADTDAVRKAYRRMARKHHPDLNSSMDSHETMARINEAFKTLSEPDLRAEYDAMLAGGTVYAPEARRAPAKPVVVKLRHRLRAHRTPVYAVAFTVDSDELVSSGFDNELIWWSGEAVARRTKLEAGVVSVLRSFPGDLLVAAGAGESQVTSYHLNGPVVVNWRAATEEWVSCLSISPDGNSIAAGSLYRALSVSDTWTGESRYRKEAHDSAVTAVAFSPDGRFLASGSADASVKMYHAETGALLHTFKQIRSTVTSIAFSADNRFLAVAAVDLSIRVFSMATGLLEKMMYGHDKPIEEMAFHPNGWLLASASRDGTLGLWNAAKGVGNVRMEVSPRPLSCVAFSPDGTSLAAGGQDKLVRVWDVAVREDSDDPGE